jgi:hypothetical protein
MKKTTFETQKMAKNKRYCVSTAMVGFNKAHACLPLAIILKINLKFKIQNHNLN